MRRRLQYVVASALNAPLSAWLVLALAAAYFLFFIQPVFLTPGAIKFFRYLPAMDPIGADLAETLSFSNHWVSTGASPYILTNSYPPLTTPLFALLLPLEFSQAYRLLTLLTLAAYATITVAIPLGMRTSKRIPTAFALIVATGLFSYGLQFELERGQFNVVAVALSMLAVWIFHRHPRHRWLAYALFVLSVQLKVYPFIFALMLIRDWRAWRDNIKRLLLLGLANLALLFVLGTGIFLDFVNRTALKSLAPPVWIYNHSFRAFVILGMERIAQRGWAPPDGAGRLIEAALVLTMVVCLAAIIAHIIRRRQTGLDPHLLLACTVLALVLPPASHDYTLAVLAAPVALLVLQPTDGSPPDRGLGLKLPVVGANIVLSAAYVCTLFPHVYKPHTLWLENNFPALLAMLMAITALKLSSPLMPAVAAPLSEGASQQR